MAHHASCKPNDKSLVWLCSQCGEQEDAEVEVQAIRERLKLAEAVCEAASEREVRACEYNISDDKKVPKICGKDALFSDQKMSNEWWFCEAHRTHGASRSYLGDALSVWRKALEAGK